MHRRQRTWGPFHHPHLGALPGCTAPSPSLPRLGPSTPPPHPPPCRSPNPMFSLSPKLLAAYGYLSKPTRTQRDKSTSHRAGSFPFRSKTFANSPRAGESWVPSKLQSPLGLCSAPQAVKNWCVPPFPGCRAVPAPCPRSVPTWKRSDWPAFHFPSWTMSAFVPSSRFLIFLALPHDRHPGCKEICLCCRCGQGF